MNRLKELRGRTYSQHEVASALGISRSTLTKYENGDIQLSEDILIKLAEFYDVSTDYLLGVSDFKKTPANSGMDDIEYALSGELKELTDAEKQDVLDYVRFKKLRSK